MFNLSKASNVLTRYILITLLVLSMVFTAVACDENGDASDDISDITSTVSEALSESSNESSEESKPVEPHIVSTASVGVSGDILIHGPLITAAGNLSETAGEYDFSSMLADIAPYYARYDFMVANLEVTLGGTAAGSYRGYPTFNCPDSIVDALLGAGVDMMLTANNHTYDTGHNGFIRTQEVLNDKGLPYIGTRLSEDVANYRVQDINGIKVGMVCYTYETSGKNAANKSLNGIPVNKADTNLVNSFSYQDLEKFYGEVEAALEGMKNDGAEANMFFIHWGEEYELTPRNYQKEIAQKLCDLGVNVIVGGHPHVIQPFETLTSATGEKTYCIYSVGNALSNQRRESLTTPPNQEHTEDGMIFGVEFQKWNDGKVEIKEISVLPTWVKREYGPKALEYSIIPLDLAVESWNGFGVSESFKLIDSYNQTLALVGKGLNEARVALGLDEVVLKIEKGSK